MSFFVCTISLACSCFCYFFSAAIIVKRYSVALEKAHRTEGVDDKKNVLQNAVQSIFVAFEIVIHET